MNEKNVGFLDLSFIVQHSSFKIGIGGRCKTSRIITLS